MRTYDRTPDSSAHSGTNVLFTGRAASVIGKFGNRYSKDKKWVQKKLSWMLKWPLHCTHVSLYLKGLRKSNIASLKHFQLRSFDCFVEGGAGRLWHTCGGHRTMFRNQFSFSIMWISELRPRSSGSAAWANSWAPSNFFWRAIIKTWKMGMVDNPSLWTCRREGRGLPVGQQAWHYSGPYFYQVSIRKCLTMNKWPILRNHPSKGTEGKSKTHTLLRFLSFLRAQLQGPWQRRKHLWHYRAAVLRAELSDERCYVLGLLWCVRKHTSIFAKVMVIKRIKEKSLLGKEMNYFFFSFKEANGKKKREANGF